MQDSKTREWAAACLQLTVSCAPVPVMCTGTGMGISSINNFPGNTPSGQHNRVTFMDTGTQYAHMNTVQISVS